MGKFVEVGGSRTFKPWAKWKVGEYVSGVFTKKSEDKFGNPNYAVRVTGTNIDGLNENDNLVLNSNGSLNYKMEEVAIGTEIQVEYKGKVKLEKGAFAGKECHDVKLLAAEVEAPADDYDL